MIAAVVLLLLQRTAIAGMLSKSVVQETVTPIHELEDDDDPFLVSCRNKPSC